ncbi:thiol reductant ABC exporter subunit CydC [Prescottella equi]|uniref:thiol reductant ABC exporter subunit CydC n=1 Tax=Rhodococcus hoagii TaxID=43767 RepID=UPI001A0F23B0|nr:thiol reductant ABC exporter subunit CydC [Prescottella equi]NKS30382.1 thiol reductant ABC exporter subunit CydC [Prescottella equi]BCN82275.1 thiol reductant ABC exporter subunit CydC [Prescottella equi]
MNRDLVRAIRLLDLEPRRVLAAIAAGVATLGSALALAALSAWLITRAWQMPPVLDLTVAVVAVRALGISRGLFRYLERLATHDAALRGTTSARTMIYRRLADGDPAAAAGLRRGDLLARTGADVDALGDVVIRALVPIAVAVVMSLSAVILLGLISPAGALVLAVALAVSGILAPWLSARAARLAESESAAATALFSETAVTALDHAAELRVAGRLDDVVARAEAADEEAVRAADRAAKPAAFAAAATPLAIGASVLGSLLIGITLYGTDGGAPGAMTPMSLAILVLVPLAAFEATGALPAAAVALTRARIASTRILELLDRAGEARPGGNRTPPDPADVRARDLRCGWPDGDKVTAPLDLDLPPGARIAVVGGSGAGKTTLLMTVAGLLPPVSGTVTVDDVPLADFRPDDLRREIGFFAEDAHLFDTSVLENLRVARGDLTEDDALSALRTVGLGEWVTRLPRGVHTSLGGGARAISGGQRRRLLLARALVSPARVLLLDEPTEHLDASDGAQILRELLDRNGSLVDATRTLMLVTHQLPADARPDRIVTVGEAPADAGDGVSPGEPMGASQRP